MDGLIVSSTQNTLFDASASDPRFPGSTGVGGNLEVKADLIQIQKAPNFTMSANGPTTGDGDSGTIKYTAFSTAVTTTSKFHLIADAASNGSGNSISSDLDSDGPQAIKFLPGNLDISFGQSAGRVNLSANGGAAGGNGGGIIAKPSAANTRFAIANFANDIVASAIGSSGNGGKIWLDGLVAFINPPTGTPFQKAIVARGGTATGDGGVVRITSGFASTGGVRQPYINMNAQVIVDGSPATDLNGFDGSIRNNGVTCQQWRSVLSSWPKSSWSCVNPDNPTAQELSIVAGAAVLSPPLRSLLGQTLTADNPTVNIYAMNSVSKFNDFFAHIPTLNEQIDLVYGTSVVGLRVSAAFVNLQNDTDLIPVVNNGNPDVMKISIVHELAHQLDFIWGSPSLAPSFAASKSNDYTILDQLPCAAVFEPGTCTQTLDNHVVLELLDPAMKDITEVFARVFAHQFAGPPPNLGYGISQEIENVYGLLQELTDQIQDLINNPPPPQR